MGYQWEKFENKCMRIQMMDTIMTVGLFLGAVYFFARYKGWV
jgi:hypothetical protein